MATQNLLQRLDQASETTGSSADASNRRIEEEFIASEAITAGDFVCLDLSKSDDSDKILFVKKLTSTAATNLCVGVAIAAAAEDANVRVCIRGMISANVDTGVAQGDRLVASSSAGRAEVYADVTIVEGGSATKTVSFKPIVAFAVGAEADNFATVYVYPQF